MKNTIFKSVVALMLILALAIPVFALPSFAADDKALTLDEANKIILEAARLMRYTTGGFWSEHIFYDINTLKEVEIEKSNMKLVYSAVDESKLPGGSYDAMIELSKSIYTEDIYLDMVANLKIPYHGANDHKIFTKFEDGKLYRTCYMLPPSFSIVCDKTFNKPDTLITRMESANEKEAVVSVGCIDGDNPDKWWAECKFVNTSDGWKITKCVLTEKIANPWDGETGLTVREDKYTNEYDSGSGAPNTADASFEQIVMLTVVATLSIVAVPVVLSRKRRAEA